MRLCFLCQEDIVRPQGGTGTYVRYISFGLAARGHDIHVITRQYNDAPAFEVVNAVSVYRVRAPGPPVLYSPWYYQQTRRKFLELNSLRPFAALHGNIPLMSSWGIQAKSLPPVIETVHCTVREELKALAYTSLRALNFNELLVRQIAPLWLQFERSLLRRAQGVIAVSAGLKRELVTQQGYPAEKIIVIPNGIDYNRFAKRPSPEQGMVIRRSLGIAPDERIILYLGRLMERKRVIDLVKALPTIQAHVPKVRLVIVGKRNHNATLIKETARQLAQEARVTLVDHVPYQDVPDYYALAEVYALPSTYEGFPFTVLEAMASGTPVVASDIPGIDEQIVPNETGLLHPVGDITAIAQAIIRVLENNELAKRLSVAAQKVVQEKYNWTVITAQIEQVFEDAVSSAALRGRTLVESS